MLSTITPTLRRRDAARSGAAGTRAATPRARRRRRWRRSAEERGFAGCCRPAARADWSATLCSHGENRRIAFSRMTDAEEHDRHEQRSPTSTSRLRSALRRTRARVALSPCACISSTISTISSRVSASESVRTNGSDRRRSAGVGDHPAKRSRSRRCAAASGTLEQSTISSDRD